MLSELAFEHGQEGFARGRRRPFADRTHRGRIVGRGEAGAIAAAPEIDREDGCAHPLIPEATIESTKKRCRRTNSSIGGSTASVAPAMTSPVFMAPRL